MYISTGNGQSHVLIIFDGYENRKLSMYMFSLFSSSFLFHKPAKTRQEGGRRVGVSVHPATSNTQHTHDTANSAKAN